jgi:hypothetical protein
MIIMEIDIKENGIVYYDEDKLFMGSGKIIPFATAYMLKNSKTSRTMKFNFDHSTGSEWDSMTNWVYLSECKCYSLVISNTDVTPEAAAAYLKHKTQNVG